MNEKELLEFISLNLGETLKELENISGLIVDFDSSDWARLEQKILLTIANNTLQPY